MVGSSLLRTLVTVLVVCLAGGATAVAVASGGRDHPEDSTTGTTGTTTGSTTGTTATGTTTGSTAPEGSAGSLRIVEIEAEAVSGGRFRLRAEIASGGARLTSVRFSYRGLTVKARRSRGTAKWSRVVRARSGDRAGDVLSIRVRACTSQRCVTRTGRDEAGR